MEKIEIKLKECCLTCEHYYPDVSVLSVYYPACGCGTEKREIRCLHMPVCQKYNGTDTQEAVRCKSCKHAYEFQPFTCVCALTDIRMPLDGFCFYGEVKEEKHTGEVMET